MEQALQDWLIANAGLQSTHHKGGQLTAEGIEYFSSGKGVHAALETLAGRLRIAEVSLEFPKNGDRLKPQGRLYNWNALSQCLSGVGVYVDGDVKTLIISGDGEVILGFLKDLLSKLDRIIADSESQEILDQQRKKGGYSAREKVGIRKGIAAPKTAPALDCELWSLPSTMPEYNEKKNVNLWEIRQVAIKQMANPPQGGIKDTFTSKIAVPPQHGAIQVQRPLPSAQPQPASPSAPLPRRMDPYNIGKKNIRVHSHAKYGRRVEQVQTDRMKRERCRSSPLLKVQPSRDLEETIGIPEPNPVAPTPVPYCRRVNLQSTPPVDVVSKAAKGQSPRPPSPSVEVKGDSRSQDTHNAEVQRQLEVFREKREQKKLNHIFQLEMQKRSQEEEKRQRIADFKKRKELGVPGFMAKDYHKIPNS